MKFRGIFKCLCVLALVVSARAVMAQELDYDEEQYNAYLNAINTDDPIARENAILEFVKANPKISLVNFAINTYIQAMDEDRKKGLSDRVFEAGEKLLKVQPDNISAQYYTAEAAYALMKYQPAVTYGEKVYASNPTPGFAYLLALSYQQLGNEAKFVEYGRKVAEETPVKDYTPGHFQILTSLRATYTREEKWDEASKYSQKVLSGFDAANIPAGWDEYMRREKSVSYAVLGRAANYKDDWASVISNFGKVIGLTNNPELVAEAYYFIGLGNWKLSKLDPAMVAFAKCSAQRGTTHADPCQKYLETLYRSTHNDSLAGLDEFKERATGSN